jgi:hypothetical protein
MSIPVELEGLAAAIAERTAAPFLLTSDQQGRPHAVSAVLSWDGPCLVGGCGRSSGRNAALHPGVSLLWPPDEPGGYSLIVDADAEVEGDGDDRRIRLTPTHAVLHRPAANPEPGSDCAHDCAPVFN